MLFSSNFSVVVVGHRLDTFSQKKKHISTHHLLCLVSLSLFPLCFFFPLFWQVFSLSCHCGTGVHSSREDFHSLFCSMGESLWPFLDSSSFSSHQSVCSRFCRPRLFFFFFLSLFEHPISFFFLWKRATTILWTLSSLFLSFQLS